MAEAPRDVALRLAHGQRFPLQYAGRWLIPLAIAVGVTGIFAAQGLGPRLFFAIGSLLMVVAWRVAHARRAVLEIHDQLFRVAVRDKSRFAVKWEEITVARAVPDEHAMYVECGEPQRNLLLPERGYGFQFERQKELYDLLAQILADRLTVVAALSPPDPRDTKKKKKDA